MNDVRNYQILKISGNKNFKRIINEIKKIDYITSASIENNKYVLHLEYSTSPKWTCSAFQNPSTALGIPNGLLLTLTRLTVFPGFIVFFIAFFFFKSAK